MRASERLSELDIANAHIFRAYYDVTAKRATIFIAFAIGLIMAAWPTVIVLILYLLLHVTIYAILRFRSKPINSAPFASFAPAALSNIDVRVLPGAYRERSIGHHGFFFAHPENPLHQRDANTLERARASFAHEIVHAKFHDFSTLVVLVNACIVGTLVFLSTATFFFTRSFLSSEALIAMTGTVSENRGLAGTARLLVATCALLAATSAALLLLIRNTLHDREYRADFFAMHLIDPSVYSRALRFKADSRKETIFQPGIEKRLGQMQSRTEGLNLIRDGILLGILLAGMIWSCGALTLLYTYTAEQDLQYIWTRILGRSFNPYALSALVPVATLIALNWKARRLRTPLRKLMKLNVGLCVGFFLMTFIPMAAYLTDKSLFPDPATYEVLTSQWAPAVLIFVALPALGSFCLSVTCFILFSLTTLVVLAIPRRRQQPTSVVELLSAQSYYAAPPLYLAGAMLWMAFRLIQISITGGYISTS